MSFQRLALVAALATTAGGLVLPSPADAVRVVGSYSTPCATSIPAAPAATWDFGRVKMVGYATGIIVLADGADIVERLAPSVVPSPFPPEDQTGTERTVRIGGGFIDLQLLSLPNQFLLGGAPFTQIGESASVLANGSAPFLAAPGPGHVSPRTSTTVKTISGAQRISMVFTGRAKISGFEFFRCNDGGTQWSVGLQKVELDGFATSPANGLESMGTGADIAITPGSTSSHPGDIPQTYDLLSQRELAAITPLVLG